MFAPVQVKRILGAYSHELLRATGPGWPYLTERRPKPCRGPARLSNYPKTRFPRGAKDERWSEGECQRVGNSRSKASKKRRTVPPQPNLLPKGEGTNRAGQRVLG